MAHPVLLDPAIVFQHQQVFHLKVPDRVKQGGSTATNAALRAGFHRSLKVFVKRNATGVERFATTNRTAQGADITSIDANTGPLTDVFDNGTGRGIDGVQ